ncbi:uncharacterized protein CELE_C36B7.3 [Caenorhabditis elegans]|uniref:Secreted protein n=1 Tax=Caenorhabditis elegans TaxID=6239 RepID=Q966P7_CAEEL|nr:Secreted protein [Caenorhabditis elegans]CCD66842.1 Secreted protein [Caenorhabditis elegans]|eukprot:NP_509197.1 Uncharacterized protein CELE_C36B7.3 [Caenorhabditis elegans]
MKCIRILRIKSIPNFSAQLSFSNMLLSSLVQGVILIFTMSSIAAMIRNETCEHSSECLEGLICEKQICIESPIQKRHPRSFHDNPKSLCVLPLVCFP